MGSFLAALSALRSHWRLFTFAILTMAVAVQTIRLGHAENVIGRAKLELSKCRQGRIDDRKVYVDAQRQATAKNEAEVIRIESEQQKVTANVEADVNARLERLRSELRARSGAPQSPARQPQTGPNGKAAGDPAGKAGLCLAPEELLRAAENEERHDQLIRWVEEQLKVQR